LLRIRCSTSILRGLCLHVRPVAELAEELYGNHLVDFIVFHQQDAKRASRFQTPVDWEGARSGSAEDSVSALSV
jgi:hypothetical protein